MKKYNKLVRDKIPELIQAEGNTCEYHVASPEEYQTKLYAKLLEELNEFIETPNVEEAADMWEVFSTICMLHKLDFAEVARVAFLKSQKRGAFNNRIILESVQDNQ
jgi:predicted house-cleaning noncanonical NTP pyrophosphatase (MazG superfamily)